MRQYLLRFGVRMGVSLAGGFALLLTIFLAFSNGSPAKSQELVSLASSYYLPIVANGLPLGPYVLLGWNDLGMHCYNHDFQDLAVLPPYNNLWAQVIKRGNPPQIVTSGIRVQYEFPDNTTSSNKTNFWTYAPQLFGVNLADNVGLTGKRLAGVMDVKSGYFVAEGIPLTEFNDSAPTTPYPYQKAVITAKSSTSEAVLATLTVVAPVSTEMTCNRCHEQGKDPGGPYAKVEQNILFVHDDEENTNLFNSRPVLCASCHSSNALNMHPNNNLPSLSRAMHRKHAEEVPNTLEGCYYCHPGPNTKCLRDVMSQTVKSKINPAHNMDCIDCHGTLSQVAANPNPWLNEPRCDTCHKATTTMQFNQDQALYRHSKGHGGVYCEACHDSTHAIAPSSEGNDAIKFQELQGHSGPIDECLVCHTTRPSGKGPHQK
jgi:hypothetical protein